MGVTDMDGEIKKQCWVDEKMEELNIRKAGGQKRGCKTDERGDRHRDGRTGG